MNGIQFIPLILAVLMLLPSFAGKADQKLVLELEVDKTKIKRGDTVNSKLTLTNRGKTARINFTTTQKFDLYLYRGSEMIWKWSEGVLFPQVIEEIVLAPGEKLTEEISWDLSKIDLRTGERIYPPPGNYKLVSSLSVLPEVRSNEISIKFTD